ncbi:MAG: YHS domain-containing protein [Bacteroidia bacterium]
MKKYIAIIPVIFILLSCAENNDQKTETTIVSKLPPEMEVKENYIKIDSALLATDKDLVCGMRIKKRIVDTTTYKGKIYIFCGTGCKVAFLKELKAYLK